MSLTIIAIIYVVGFFISLIVLSKYGKVLGWDHYDPPHDSWYDDYDSNAQAYLGFSFAWPFFWLFGFIRLIYLGLLKISEILVDINKK